MPDKTCVILIRFIRPHHFPVLMAIFTTLACVSGYAISVSFDKVHYLFPYISSVGSTAPASCYFGIFLNLASICTAYAMYYRHKYLENHPTMTSSDAGSFHLINDVGYFIGLLSALGMMIVANFQTSHVQSIHFFGAFLVFIFGGVYGWMQTYLTRCSALFLQQDGGRENKLYYFRLFLVVGISLSFVVAIVGLVISNKQIGHTAVTLNWTSDMKASEIRT